MLKSGENRDLTSVFNTQWPRYVIRDVSPASLVRARVTTTTNTTTTTTITTTKILLLQELLLKHSDHGMSSETCLPLAWYVIILQQQQQQQQQLRLLLLDYYYHHDYNYNYYDTVTTVCHQRCVSCKLSTCLHNYNTYSGIIICNNRDTFRN